ncbi:unnamed protein product, partial [Cyprideis torosa]
MDVTTLQSKTRKRHIVQARQLAMYFAKRMTKASLASIGSQIGSRDHATVLHACILKSKVDPQKVYVDSAGTGGWHVGHLPDVRSIEIARNYDLDITDQRCRRFSPIDFHKFDWIYVMDRSNYSDVIEMASSDLERNK